MSPARLLLLALFAGLVPVLSGGTVACSGTDAQDTYVPITGVLVRAETLTRGRGCGVGANQIFKYAAVVLGRNPSSSAFDVFLAGNVYDCFADGQFVGLPASGGLFDYTLQIYAYNELAYRAAGDAAIRAAATNPAQLPTTNPTFTTTCQATQLKLAQALAVCQPLTVGSGAAIAPATVSFSTATFTGAEGGIVTCGSEFAGVRYRASVNGAAGAVTESPCRPAGSAEPLTVRITPAVAPASYVIDVELLRADGTVLGRTTCGAETSPGLSSSAVCKPLQ